MNDNHIIVGKIKQTIVSHGNDNTTDEVYTREQIKKMLEYSDLRTKYHVISINPFIFFGYDRVRYKVLIISKNLWFLFYFCDDTFILITSFYKDYILKVKKYFTLKES